MEDLTAFQRDLLYIITGLEAPYGLAIKQELQEYYSEEINHGRLYPNLDELAQRELLEKGTRDRRTNEYSITQKGRERIKARREWEKQYIEIESNEKKVTPAD